MFNQVKNKKIIKIIILIIIAILLFCFIMKNFFPAEWSFITPHKQGDFVRVGDIQSDACGVASQALDNGKVLLFCSGGSRANIYNPATRKFNVVDTYCDKTSAVLGAYLKINNGDVLIFGGNNNGSTSRLICGFDSKRETFSYVAEMSEAREQFAASLFDNGLIFISGGSINNSVLSDSTEIFNSINKNSSRGPNLLIERHRHKSILTNNAKVLIIGGSNQKTYELTIEVYDPLINKIMSAGKLIVGRDNPILYKLKNGNILIIGGWHNGVMSREIEIYNPKTQKSKIIARRDFGAEYIGVAHLVDDTILFYGGSSGFSLSYRDYKNAAIFNPETGVFKKIENVLKRTHPGGGTSAMLNDKNILIMGNSGKDFRLRNAEIYMFSNKIEK